MDALVTLLTSAGASDEGLLLAADPHHHGGIGLLREQRWNNHGDAAGDLAAESAAGVLADEDDLLRVDIQPTCDRGPGLRGALGSAVNVDLAILPICHGTAC